MHDVTSSHTISAPACLYGAGFSLNAPPPRSKCPCIDFTWRISRGSVYMRCMIHLIPLHLSYLHPHQSGSALSSSPFIMITANVARHDIHRFTCDSFTRHTCTWKSGSTPSPSTSPSPTTKETCQDNRVGLKITIYTFFSHRLWQFEAKCCW